MMLHWDSLKYVSLQMTLEAIINTERKRQCMEEPHSDEQGLWSLQELGSRKGNK